MDYFLVPGGVDLSEGDKTCWFLDKLGWMTCHVEITSQIQDIVLKTLLSTSGDSLCTLQRNLEQAHRNWTVWASMSTKSLEQFRLNCAVMESCFFSMFQMLCALKASAVSRSCRSMWRHASNLVEVTLRDCMCKWHRCGRLQTQTSFRGILVFDALMKNACFLGERTLCRYSFPEF